MLHEHIKIHSLTTLTPQEIDNTGIQHNISETNDNKIPHIGILILRGNSIQRTRGNFSFGHLTLKYTINQHRGAQVVDVFVRREEHVQLSAGLVFFVQDQIISNQFVVRELDEM